MMQFHINIRRKKRYLSLALSFLAGIIFTSFMWSVVLYVAGDDAEEREISVQLDANNEFPETVDLVEMGTGKTDKAAKEKYKGEKNTAVAEKKTEKAGAEPKKSVADAKKSPVRNEASATIDAAMGNPDTPLYIAKGKIRSGDSLSIILHNWASPQMIHDAAKSCKKVFSLNKIRVGRPWKATIEYGKLTAFEYDIDDTKQLHIDFLKDRKVVASIVPIHYDVEINRLEIPIEETLSGAVEKLGESVNIAYSLSDIFGWEVDFSRDIRNGDHFTVLIEKRYRDGKFKGYGDILAARFVNDGTVHEGFLLKNEQGRNEYFAANGRSLRKAFLKVPLNFVRISSGYSNARMHPILKYVRPHRGIDYAAPIGTPVWAIGNGKVVTVARSKAAGKYITLQHSNGYKSSYLHLSRFAKGLKRGKKVTQGEVIGYVGSTGYSTGPHLDFRIQHNGTFINPKQVTNPRAEPVQKADLARFTSLVAGYTAQLDNGVMLADQEAQNVDEKLQAEGKAVEGSKEKKGIFGFKGNPSGT